MFVNGILIEHFKILLPQVLERCRICLQHLRHGKRETSLGHAFQAPDKKRLPNSLSPVFGIDHQIGDRHPVIATNVHSPADHFSIFLSDKSFPFDPDQRRQQPVRYHFPSKYSSGFLFEVFWSDSLR